MKCKYCGKTDIEENMVKEVRVKDGEPVLNKRTKEPLYDYYHLACKTHRDNVKDLKEYITRLNGADAQFPTRVMASLKPIYEKYGYTQLLSYLYSIEDYLTNAKCNNRSHRMNLMVYMVRNNIDDYVESNRPQEIPTQHEDIKFITKTSKKSFNDDNYDLI